jgi:hypothetical protein
MSTRGISPRLHPAPGLCRFSQIFHDFSARTQFFFDTLYNSYSMGDPRKMRRGHPRTQVRLQFLTFLLDPRCDSCLRFLAGRYTTAPRFRVTTFGGLNHLEGFSPLHSEGYILSPVSPPMRVPRGRDSPV